MEVEIYEIIGVYIWLWDEDVVKGFMLIYFGKVIIVFIIFVCFVFVVILILLLVIFLIIYFK